ncbi:hypothetical protein FLONG3_4395 [Fusarium longipes]|uniref:Uncharacterized protein n=1 Tax=Fusarium longipes TaxID=694270 RepID=A0A395SZ32_9HYPO|nr:hypothetical protein FLONG3_4395 [Fusarium longipes]
MAPSEFGARLQKGIVGGFAPPTPNLIINVDCNDGNLHITSATRAEGTPALGSPQTKTVAVADHETIIDELHGILKNLPTEQPPGSEDIYGFDTSIAWYSDDLQWYNGGPEGCGGGESSAKATEEDKKKFKRAIEIIKKISGEE